MKVAVTHGMDVQNPTSRRTWSSFNRCPKPLRSSKTMTEKQQRTNGIISTSRKQQYDKALFLFAILGLFVVSRILSIFCITSYFSSNHSGPFESQEIVFIEPWCTNNQTDVICHYRKTIQDRPVNLLPTSSNNTIIDKAIVVVNADTTRKKAVHLLTATRSFNAGLRDRQHRDHRLMSHIVGRGNGNSDNKHQHSHTSFPLIRQQRIHASTSSLTISSLYSKPTFLSTSLHEAQVIVRTVVSIIDNHPLLNILPLYYPTLQ